MNEGFIGLWIARFTEPTRTGALSQQITKWHRVESDIAGRQVTHCGRQMGEIHATVLAPLVAPPSPESTCKRCNPQVG